MLLQMVGCDGYRGVRCDGSMWGGGRCGVVLVALGCCREMGIGWVG